MAYTAEWAAAYADVQAAGVAVTFTFTVNGTYDAATDRWTGGSTITVSGVAIERGNDPLIYKALGLISSELQTLLFLPDTYGTMPPLGASVTWGGTDFTVKHITNLAPDGTPIFGKVVVAR